MDRKYKEIHIAFPQTTEIEPTCIVKIYENGICKWLFLAGKASQKRLLNLSIKYASVTIENDRGKLIYIYGDK